MANEAMDAIDRDFEIVNDSTKPLEARLAAALNLETKMWLSHWVSPLGTAGNTATFEIANETLQRLDKHSQTVHDALQNAPGPVADILLRLLNLLRILVEIIQEFALLVGEIPIGPQGDPQGVDPSQWNDGLEPPNADIKASIAVNGLFLHRPPFGDCGEKSFPLPVECGGCGVVIKEFRGLQLRLVLRLVRKVIEPWFSRRRIINTWVWVLEWVPVQVIKTITVRCGCDDGATKVTKTTVLDRELSSFWRCL